MSETIVTWSITVSQLSHHLISTFYNKRISQYTKTVCFLPNCRLEEHTDTIKVRGILLAEPYIMKAMLPRENAKAKSWMLSNKLVIYFIALNWTYLWHTVYMKSTLEDWLGTGTWKLVLLNSARDCPWLPGKHKITARGNKWLPGTACWINRKILLMLELLLKIFRLTEAIKTIKSQLFYGL